MGIAHVFPGYTIPVIYELEYELWVMLALDYDAYVEDTKKTRAHARRSTRR